VNGELVEEAGLTEPPPFSEIVTLVALPPNVFPERVKATVPHELPEMLLKVTVAGLVHCPNSFPLKIKTNQTKMNVLVIYCIFFNSLNINNFRSI
jgi:hypothetical protein